MQDEYFEWDDAKAAANYRKHKVSFEHAAEACEDYFALIVQDMLTVIYTDRGERIRIISAREANEHERRNYYSAAQRK